MNDRPDYPWHKGVHDNYSAAVVEVTVCQVPSGLVYSAHELQAGADHRVVSEWNGGGQQQIAFALLVEATRREAVLDILIQQTKDPSFIPDLQAASEEERKARFEKMGRALRRTMNHIIEQLAPSSLEEAFLSMTEPEPQVDQD